MYPSFPNHCPFLLFWVRMNIGRRFSAWDYELVLPESLAFAYMTKEPVSLQGKIQKDSTCSR